MTNYVLVHGAWHGGWCWSRVVPLLRNAGHEAYAVTLTGVGERAHLLSRDIRLKTHIQDVLGVIRSEELQDVVLVGHSYAGLVITGVADRLLQENGDIVRHLVYVDAVTPHPGESWSSQHASEVIEERLRAAQQSGGIAIPPPDASVFGLENADRIWVNRRQTPQPFGVYHEGLEFDDARVSRLPRTFIDCTSPPLATIAEMRKRVRAEPGWRVVEIPTGHDPMISSPGDLVECLLGCVS